VNQSLKAAFMAGACLASLVTAVSAETFNIPDGDLAAALSSYTRQTGIELMVSGDAVKGARTRGARGELTDDQALTRLLAGSGFSRRLTSSGGVAIVPDRSSRNEILQIAPIQLAQASQPARAAVETVTVTSSKLGGADVQSIPIAITALNQEQLTATQTAGGPDLVKNVPNLTFTKTNFTGYSIEIRGIGTQAISVTTDPAVAVAFNDIPFIRNHFFEQEFYDVGQVEVLRGPQGTLYGRNATAGVVNITSAKPADHWEAMASVDVGNYQNRRMEGMINVPILGDQLDFRAAGEWTKRDGYSFNETTNKPVDGRDLWSSRASLRFHPSEDLTITAIWEHFQEDDDRIRSSKQLCKKDPGPSSVDGLDLDTVSNSPFYHAWLSQGCLPTSLYLPDAFQTPNGQAIPFVTAGEFFFNGLGGGATNGFLLNQVDPYASTIQSRNLRNIQSDLTPAYSAKNDTLELNADFEVTPELKLSSQTGYNKDQLRSTEDFNRFNTAPGLFGANGGNNGHPNISPGGIYCDPQLGCSDKMVGEDLSQEHAWQFSQELRLASDFNGPLNFSIGANYMHYQTLEDYFVFFNLVTATEQLTNGQGPGDFTLCHPGFGGAPFTIVPSTDYVLADNGGNIPPSNFGCGVGGTDGTYIDPNPITSLDGLGHNYFRSQNPYRLNSWAGFGEAYYQLSADIKLTGGLRWTDDRKLFVDIPSWTFLVGGGYPVAGTVKQEWKEWTGRAVVDWTPRLAFTDQTLVYGSYSRGYKGGGANPPPPQPNLLSGSSFVVHPADFQPEFVNAFELGTKNTLLDGSMTLNGDVFYYDYKGYQISQIVDRTSININVDAKVKGAEVEATWEPLPGLRFNLAGGLEDSSINRGQSAIDLIDRTAGHSDWMIFKPYLTSTSNCILPQNVVRQLIETFPQSPTQPAVFNIFTMACDIAYYSTGGSAFNGLSLSDFGITGFDPSTAPNNGEGFAKDLSGNSLPNTPPFTLSFGAQYSMPVSEDWAGTLRGDFYWQGNSFARIFNDKPYDQLHGYTNLNFTLIFTNQDGWQAMAYVKNALNTTAITGAFLNSDDTALTTNVFLTDPRLFGLRLSKNW